MKWQRSAQYGMMWRIWTHGSCALCTRANNIKMYYVHNNVKWRRANLITFQGSIFIRGAHCTAVATFWLDFCIWWTWIVNWLWLGQRLWILTKYLPGAITIWFVFVIEFWFVGVWMRWEMTSYKPMSQYHTKKNP